MKKVLFLTILTVSGFLFLQEAKAATLTLRPNGAGDATQLSRGGGSANWDAVDDIVSDDWGSYVYKPNVGFGYDLYGLPDAAGESGAISSVVIYVRMLYESFSVGDNGAIYLKTNGAVYSSSKSLLNGAWVTYSTAYAVNPQTGLAWTWAEINALQVGVGLKTDEYCEEYEGEMYCEPLIAYATQVYAVVNYVSGPAIPTVTTQAATNIQTNSATGNGNITATGGENADRRGVRWGIVSGIYTNTSTDSGSFGAGVFTKNMTGLNPGTAYYYQAMAHNSAGWGYGSEQNFVTVIVPPPPCQSHNVGGWAWSENIGWISFSCENTVAIGSGTNYGVDINSETGMFSGYVWSENVGWIDFAPAGPYPASPNYSVCLNFPGAGQVCDSIPGSNRVGGWARALSYGGGWDGWIKFRGSNYGVDYTPQSGELSGWAWSDMVIGWISFKGTNYGVVTTAKLPPSVSTAGETWKHCTYKGKSIPTLNWNYFDGTQAAYQVQIDDTSASFPSPEVDTGEILFSSSAYTPTYTFNWDTRYYWRVKAKNQQGVWSNWSNIDSFDMPLHAYPWPDFTWEPIEPTQNETVEFNPDSSVTYGGAVISSYLWSIIQGTGNFVDGTSGTSRYPHIQFSTLNNKVKLKITDSTPGGGYSCGAGAGEGEKEITAQLPLPEYKRNPADYLA